MGHRALGQRRCDDCRVSRQHARSSLATYDNAIDGRGVVDALAPSQSTQSVGGRVQVSPARRARSVWSSNRMERQSTGTLRTRGASNRRWKASETQPLEASSRLPDVSRVLSSSFSDDTNGKGPSSCWFCFSLCLSIVFCTAGRQEDHQTNEQRGERSPRRQGKSSHNVARQHFDAIATLVMLCCC